MLLVRTLSGEAVVYRQEAVLGGGYVFADAGKGRYFRDNEICRACFLSEKFGWRQAFRGGVGCP